MSHSGFSHSGLGHGVGHAGFTHSVGHSGFGHGGGHSIGTHSVGHSLGGHSVGHGMGHHTSHYTGHLTHHTSHAPSHCPTTTSSHAPNHCSTGTVQLPVQSATHHASPQGSYSVLNSSLLPLSFMSVPQTPKVDGSTSVQSQPVSRSYPTVLRDEAKVRGEGISGDEKNSRAREQTCL